VSKTWPKIRPKKDLLAYLQFFNFFEIYYFLDKKIIQRNAKKQKSYGRLKNV
jgi:hypothetical protein